MCLSTHLVSVVKLIIHESGDNTCLSYALITQEDLRNRAFHCQPQQERCECRAQRRSRLIPAFNSST